MLRTAAKASDDTRAAACFGRLGRLGPCSRCRSRQAQEITKKKINFTTQVSHSLGRRVHEPGILRWAGRARKRSEASGGDVHRLKRRRRTVQSRWPQVAYIRPLWRVSCPPRCFGPSSECHFDQFVPSKSLVFSPATSYQYIPDTLWYKPTFTPETIPM